MTLVVLDAALRLPPALRDLSIKISADLASRMVSAGSRSHFTLGDRVPGTANECYEPHLSLFMLAVTESEVEGVVQAVKLVAAQNPAVAVVGQEYRHNPVGAPELHLVPSLAWSALQAKVVDAVEPLRRGRLRDRDPSGTVLQELVDDLRRTGEDPQRLAQLLRYGYDEITDHSAQRFSPHITFAWPVDGHRVGLDGLPPASDVVGELTDLAVYQMREHGTCTQLHGVFPLG